MWVPKHRLGTRTQNGVAVCWTRDLSAEALEAGLGGLDFLAFHDPRRMKRLRRHCPSVAFAAVIRSSMALFQRPCVLDFVPTASAIDNACQLVHDATHALLHQRTDHSLVLAEAPWVRYRIEHLCLLEESRFLRGVHDVLNGEQRAYAAEHRQWVETALKFEFHMARCRQVANAGELFDDEHVSYPETRPVDGVSVRRRADDGFKEFDLGAYRDDVKAHYRVVMGSAA